jgi:hypothetical protein
MIMRILTTFAALAALAVALPAYAQSQSPRAQPREAAPPEAQSGQHFKKVEVVDMKDLPPTTQTQVNAVIAKTNAEDLQSLRSSIDGIPQALTALKAKGLSSSQVVAANVDDNGTLTLITKVT